MRIRPGVRPQDRKQAKLAVKLVMARKKRNVQRIQHRSLISFDPRLRCLPSRQEPDKLAVVDPGGLATRQAPEIPDEGSRVEWVATGGCSLASARRSIPFGEGCTYPRPGKVRSRTELLWKL